MDDGDWITDGLVKLCCLGAAVADVDLVGEVNDGCKVGGLATPDVHDGVLGVSVKVDVEYIENVVKD